MITLLAASGVKACAEDTGAYCRARAKLSESVLQRLTGDISAGCEAQLPVKWLWRGRHVHLVDGTTVSMPDTPANQAAYPQHAVQQEGLGFPIARMVVPLSLATAMVGVAVHFAKLVGTGFVGFGKTPVWTGDSRRNSIGMS